jgi:hypothetical protein
MPHSNSAIRIVMKPNGKEKFRTAAALLLYIAEVLPQRTSHIYSTILT